MGVWLLQCIVQEQQQNFNKNKTKTNALSNAMKACSEDVDSQQLAQRSAQEDASAKRISVCMYIYVYR